MSEEDTNDKGGQVSDTGSVEPSFVNLDGTFGDMTKASEGVRDFVAKKGFKSIDEQTAAHVELEGMLGQRDKLVVIPDDGDKEGWQKFNIRMGRPKTAEEYVFTPRGDNDPKPEESLLTLFKEYALEKGMNQTAFQDTINFQMDAILAADKVYADQLVTERTEAQKAIRGRFNTEDEYTEFTQKGMAFAEKFKLDEKSSVMDLIERKGLAHDPEILDMMGQLSDMTVEDPLGERTRTSTASLESKIEAIQKDPAFVNVMDPNHYPIMAEYHALFQPEKREG